MPANGRNAPPRPDLPVAQGTPREPRPTGLWMVGLVAVLVILLLFFAAIL